MSEISHMVSPVCSSHGFVSNIWATVHSLYPDMGSTYLALLWWVLFLGNRGSVITLCYFKPIWGLPNFLCPIYPCKYSSQIILHPNSDQTYGRPENGRESRRLSRLVVWVTGCCKVSNLVSQTPIIFSSGHLFIIITVRHFFCQVI